jgi:TP901 family phage tail tape measure protein
MAEEGTETEKVAIVELIIKAVDELTEPIENAEKSLRGLIGDLREAAASSFEVFAGYETLEHIIEPAAEMQYRLAVLREATGATNEQIKEFKESAEAASVAWGTSAEDMVSAQTQLARTFGNTEKAMEGASIGAQYALATQQNVAVAAQGLSEAWQTIGDHTKPFAESLMDVADRLTYLQTKFNLSGVSAQAFGRMFANISGQAKQFHLPMDQLEGMMAEMSRLGYQGARAIMIVRESINQIFGGEKGFGANLAKFGILIGKDPVTKEINILATLQHAYEKQHAQFERFVAAHGQAGIVIEQLVTHMEEWKKATEEVGHQQGLTTKDAQSMANTFKTAFENFQKALYNFADTLGTVLLPALTKILVVLTDLITSFQAFAQAHPYLVELMSLFVAFVAVLVTLAGLFGMVVGFLALIVTSLTVLGTDLAGIIIGLGAFAAIMTFVGSVVYDNWNTIVRVWQWAVLQIRDFMQLWNHWVNDPWRVTKSLWQDAKDWLGNIGDEIGNLLSDIWNNPLKAAESFWNGIKTGFVDLSEFITRQSGYTLAIGEILALAFGGIWGGAIYLIIVGIMELINHWKDLKDWFVGNFPTMTHLIEVFRDVIESAFDFIGKKIDWIITKFNDFLSLLKEVGSAILGTFTPNKDFAPYLSVPPSSAVPQTVRPSRPEPPPVRPFYPTGPHAPGFNPSSYITGSQTFHYSPVVNVYTNGTDQDSLRDTLTGVLADDKMNWDAKMREHNNNDRRTTYTDLVYPT